MRLEIPRGLVLGHRIRRRRMLQLRCLRDGREHRPVRHYPRARTGGSLHEGENPGMARGAPRREAARHDPDPAARQGPVPGGGLRPVEPDLPSGPVLGPLRRLRRAHPRAMAGSLLEGLQAEGPADRLLVRVRTRQGLFHPRGIRLPVAAVRPRAEPPGPQNLSLEGRLRAQPRPRPAAASRGPAQEPVAVGTGRQGDPRAPERSRGGPPPGRVRGGRRFSGQPGVHVAESSRNAILESNPSRGGF
mmetsp:Transcript_6311/g.15643  ORF Transcript_6311/g.15643 Transcript_6311/m.15643 type:complete len:246 (+) Transcript_6311:2108-2845(+)